MPQRIYGPRGTRAFVDGLLELWRDERALRIAHERRPSTAGFTAEVVEYGEGPVVALPGVSVAAVHVDHRPVEEAYGFVFRADDGDRKSVVEGKSVSVRVDLGGRRIITKKTNKSNEK